MLPVNLNDLAPAHIQGLIDSEVAESLTLEYKQQLPSKQSEEKRDFLYDVAAMANAAGGDMVFGITERRTADNKKTGIADGLLGVRFPAAQDEIIRLASYIRDCIAPRLTGVAMACISCPEGDVLLIRISASKRKPHMVTMGGVDKFYKRTGTTNNPMTVYEIGRAFSEQGELREAIARWRSHRLDLIEQRQGPVILSGEVAMLFHLIPADALTPGDFTEAWRLPEHQKKEVFVPYGNYYQQYNADGFLCHSNRAHVGPPQESDGYHGYTQLFRSGIVEYAFSHFFRPPIGLQIPLIDGQEVEQAMVRCYEDAIRRYREEGRTGTVYVGFSMAGLLNKQIFSTLTSWSSREYGVRQPTFMSPETMAELSDLDERPYTRTLRPLVDTFWQLDGREGTPFVLDGAWDPFRRYD